MLLHFLHFFYWPRGQPWYTGAVWGNVFVGPIVIACGWFWSKTKYWPFGLIHKKLDALHAKHDRLHEMHAEHLDQLQQLAERVDGLHDKHDELRDVLASGSGGGASNAAGGGSTPS